MIVVVKIFSFLMRQREDIVNLLLNRWACECKLLFLSSKRAWKLSKGVDLILYLSWLWSNFGWRRHKVLYFHRSIFVILIQLIWIFIVITMLSSFNLENYSYYIFNFFGDMELSDRGYFGYTVVICVTISWLLQLLLLSCSEWFRELIRPYKTRLLTVNLVIFLLLMSLGAQVARAQLGIRVWYPYERSYSDRISASYWD